MMSAVREYLLSVVATCLICAIAGTMVKNEMSAKVLRLVSGILVLLVVVAPLLSVDFDDISERMSYGLADDSRQLDDVRKDAEERLAEQVRTATEMHIEQIAARYNMTVQASVQVDAAQIPTPISVELIGTFDPEQIAMLTDYIAQNIGIPKENQHWRGYEAEP